ncbi:hypothetical protein A6281_01265 [Bacillus wiedmannii]|nr:hypothetical protein [Bacillus wiedmannii]OAK22899.1 hypothetical protein A6281_01265 [Bacillus wiedmannii]OAK24956.1 hypothetical protein A6282_02265 [Bacillus wiedmannii]
MEASLSKVKEEFYRVKTLKLPREYEDSIFYVLSSSELLINSIDTGVSKDTVMKLLNDNIKKVYEVAEKYEA